MGVSNLLLAVIIKLWYCICESSDGKQIDLGAMLCICKVLGAGFASGSLVISYNFFFWRIVVHMSSILRATTYLLYTIVRFLVIIKPWMGLGCDGDVDS
jgi:hypothetical protein